VFIFIQKFLCIYTKELNISIHADCRLHSSSCLFGSLNYKLLSVILQHSPDLHSLLKPDLMDKIFLETEKNKVNNQGAVLRMALLLEMIENLLLVFSRSLVDVI